MTINLSTRELLRGLAPGRPQTVGNMTVIPLLLDSVGECDGIAPFTSAKYSTVNYGVVRVSAGGPQDVIIPSQLAIMTKEAAQNHALMSALVVEHGKVTDVNTAACIQQTQPGFIREDSPQDLVILPYALREEAHNMRAQANSYSKLWPAIARLNAMGNAKASGHLEYFLDRHKQTLDEFVAEFEVVDKQVGAIVLIGGVVYGVERAPTMAYWREVWEPLVRVCYGTQAYLEAKASGDRNLSSQSAVVVPESRTPINMSGVRDLDGLMAAYRVANDTEAQNARDAVSAILDDAVISQTQEPSKTVTDYQTWSVSSRQFVGQVVVRNQTAVCYASLVTASHWRKNKDWHNAKTFRL